MGQMLQFNRFFTIFQKNWDDTAAITILGCIDDRDFTPGVPILDNTVDAIHSSYKVILVLTDHFVSSQMGQMLQFNRFFTIVQKNWDDTAAITILISNII
jgi:hypothetical protein